MTSEYELRLLQTIYSDTCQKVDLDRVVYLSLTVKSLPSPHNIQFPFGQMAKLGFAPPPVNASFRPSIAMKAEPLDKPMMTGSGVSSSPSWRAV